MSWSIVSLSLFLNLSAADELAPEKTYPPIATSGQFQNEVNCFAAFSSEKEIEKKAFVFIGTNEGKNGFYILTSKAIHFYVVDKKAHQECFEMEDLLPENDRGVVRFTPNNYYFYDVKIPGEPSFYLNYRIPRTDLGQHQKESAAPSTFVLPGKPEYITACPLANHETITTESKEDLATELTMQISQTHKNFKDELNQLRPTAAKRTDFPEGSFGDSLYKSIKEEELKKQSTPLPNPLSYINQLKACENVKVGGVKIAVKQQLKKFPKTAVPQEAKKEEDAHK